MNVDRHAEISERAYRIWQAEGQPEGKAIEHWLRAESELKAPEPVQQPGSAGVRKSKPAAARRKTR